MIWERSSAARGSSHTGPVPRQIGALGMSSLTCWKAQRLNGGVRQFYSVTIVSPSAGKVFIRSCSGISSSVKVWAVKGVGDGVEGAEHLLEPGILVAGKAA